MKAHSLPRPCAALSTAGALIFALVGPPIAPGRSADVKGWYTQAQAEQGHQLFNNYCAECHRPDLTGAMGPALVGDAFLKRWGNRPLGDLFGFEHSKMPAVNPGSVPEQRDVEHHVLHSPDERLSGRIDRPQPGNRGEQDAYRKMTGSSRCADGPCRSLHVHGTVLGF